MNSDSSEELMPQGQDRYRLNCRVLSNQDGNIGNITTVNGNTLTSFSLPLGNNIVIGSKEYPLGKKVYYFVYNSTNLHSILEYDSVANTIAKVFQDGIVGNAANILNFDKDHLITGINIIELTADAHLLCWTDNFNEPRKINIEKGKLYISSGGTDINGYINSPGIGFDPRIIYIIKQPPLLCPESRWLGSLSNEAGFRAETSTSVSIGAVMLDKVPFDLVIYGAPEFNVSTFEWTVATTGYYKVETYVGVSTLAPPAPPGTGNLYIYKNGVPLTTLVMSVIDDTYHYYDITENNILLIAGDVLSVYVGYIDINYDAGDAFSFFTATYLGSATSTNHLFKKLFQFKHKFIYDDYEESAYSPISVYAFPETTGDPSKPDDIVLQYSILNVTVQTGSSIVKKIRVVAKEVNSANFSLIAEFDKSELIIADNSTYTFPFINDGNYVPIEINDSIKLFDSVPLLAQTQEFFFSNRMVWGLITEGYDNVPIDMNIRIYHDTFIASINNNHFPNQSFLKSSGVYTVGIVYYDTLGNRSGVANIVHGKSTELQPNGTYGTTMYIPFLTDPNYAPGVTTALMNNIPKVDCEIYNNPPTWATHYQIVRSKNLSVSKYLQFTAKAVTYTGNNIELIVNNIYTDYKTAYPLSTLDYGFTKGDRIRFIAPRASSTTIGTPFFFNDSEIIDFDEGTGKLIVRDNFSAPSGMVAGVLFEIYTPSLQIINDNELVFEFCEINDIGTDVHGNLIHNGALNQLIVQSTSSTNGSPLIVAQVSVGHGLTVARKVKIIGIGWSTYGVISISNVTNVTIDYSGQVITGTYNSTTSTIIEGAIINIESGDCFRRKQDNIYGAGDTLTINVEAMNASNMFASLAWDYGRPNRIDANNRQVTRPATLIYSQQLVPETFINGLSSVFDTNFETYESKYGGIYKLYAKDQTLIMFQELKVAPIPILQNVFSGTQGGTVVGTSTQVLSPSVQYYTGEYGIGRNPESFAVYGNSIYFMDVNSCTPLRLSRDGLTPLSDEGFMGNYFLQKCSQVLSVPFQVKVYGTYDLEFGEYIISFEDVEGSPGETIAFDEGNNTFNTFYSYLPENMCWSGAGLLSFKNGALWVHNSNTIQNNFYGVQYTSDLWTILNDNPENEKIFTAIEETSKEVWTVPSISNIDGQESNLIESDFQQKEQQQQYAAVWKDVNTPNLVSGTELFNGDPMRSRTFLIKLRYSGTTFSRLYSLNLRYIISNLHNR